MMHICLHCFQVKGVAVSEHILTSSGLLHSQQQQEQSPKNLAQKPSSSSIAVILCFVLRRPSSARGRRQPPCILILPRTEIRCLPSRSHRSPPSGVSATPTRGVHHRHPRTPERHAGILGAASLSPGPACARNVRSCRTADGFPATTCRHARELHHVPRCAHARGLTCTPPRTVRRAPSATSRRRSLFNDDPGIIQRLLGNAVGRCVLTVSNASTYACGWGTRRHRLAWRGVLCSGATSSKARCAGGAPLAVFGHGRAEERAGCQQHQRWTFRSRRAVVCL